MQDLRVCVWGICGVERAGEWSEWAATLLASSVRLYVFIPFYSIFYCAPFFASPSSSFSFLHLPSTQPAEPHEALLDVDIELASWHPDAPLLNLLNSTLNNPKLPPLRLLCNTYRRRWHRATLKRTFRGGHSLAVRPPALLILASELRFLTSDSRVCCVFRPRTVLPDG